MQNRSKQNGKNQAKIANNIYPVKQQVNAVTAKPKKTTIPYDAALELERSGELAVWESEQERLKNTPRLDSKPVDANLDMYQRLLKISPEIATEFVLECRAKGIILDVEAGTVTRADANLKQVQTGGAA